MPNVTRLSITPVKSMRLHHPDRVQLETFGVLADRRFYVADPIGRLWNNKRSGPLQLIRAEWDPATERLSLLFPDGTVLEGDATSVDGPVQTDFWGRKGTGRVVAGPFGQVLSDYVGTPVVLVRADAPGMASDSAPVSLYSTASADEMDRQAGRDTPHDRRRWRMLVEVNGCAPHEEDRWIGSRIRLGQAVIRVISPVARCVVTTQDPDTGLPDFDTLRTIKEYRGVRGEKSLDFGVYAEVETPGEVAMGDTVEVIGPLGS